MSKQLPPRPHLDQLKKQAKELLKGHQAARPAAVAAIKEHFPRLSDASEAEILRAEITLQNAQHVVACEYGFAGWDELSAAIAPLVEEEPQLSDRWSFSGRWKPGSAPAAMPLHRASLRSTIW